MSYVDKHSLKSCFFLVFCSTEVQADEQILHLRLLSSLDLLFSTRRSLFHLGRGLEEHFWLLRHG